LHVEWHMYVNTQTQEYLYALKMPDGKAVGCVLDSATSSLLRAMLLQCLSPQIYLSHICLSPH